MEIVTRKISELKPADYNPRKLTENQEADIRTSLDKFGLVDPVIVNTYPGRENVIVGGHQRVTVCKKLGLKEVPTVEVSLSLDDEKELNVRLNKNSGEWDFVKLDTLFPKAELIEWGFKFEELDFTPVEFRDGLVADKIDTDIRLGDLFEIGPHRLLCGDSSKPEDVGLLMAGDIADISFSSPPYNLGKALPSREGRYVLSDDNMSNEAYFKLLVDFTFNSLENCRFTFVNIQSLSPNKRVLIDYMYQMKPFYADTLVWKKKMSVPNALTSNILNSQFEYVHVFSKKANKRIGAKWFKGSMTNVVEIDYGSYAQEMHHASFPVELASFFVFNFSKNSVLDLFLGTGTTMIASHPLGRRCYGMEMEPKYCQITIDRMRSLDMDIKVKKIAQGHG